MKKNSLRTKISLLAIVFCAASLTSFGQEKKSTTITGEVLDMACYAASGASGEGHKTCAAKCIKGGSPMGLLTSDGKVWRWDQATEALSHT